MYVCVCVCVFAEREINEKTPPKKKVLLPAFVIQTEVTSEENKIILK